MFNMVKMTLKTTAAALAIGLAASEDAQVGFRNSSGSFAKFTAILRALFAGLE
jgi:hypothetical protein